MSAAIENGGLPIFNVTMDGIQDDLPYFYIDLSNS